MVLLSLTCLAYFVLSSVNKKITELFVKAPPPLIIRVGPLKQSTTAAARLLDELNPDVIARLQAACSSDSSTTMKTMTLIDIYDGQPATPSDIARLMSTERPLPSEDAARFKQFCQCRRGLVSSGPGSIGGVNYGSWPVMQNYYLYPATCGSSCSCVAAPPQKRAFLPIDAGQLKSTNRKPSLPTSERELHTLSVTSTYFGCPECNFSDPKISLGTLWKRFFPCAMMAMARTAKVRRTLLVEEKWGGYKDKPALLLKYLKSEASKHIPLDALVVFVDAYDVVTVRP